MTRTWIDTITETPEDKRLFEQERAILEVTELICQLMEEQGISKTKLARKMGTSKANITQMLDGRRNMTIRTISDLLFHLNHIFKMDVGEAVKDVDERLRLVAQETPQVLTSKFSTYPRALACQFPNPDSLGRKNHGGTLRIAG